MNSKTEPGGLVSNRFQCGNNPNNPLTTGISSLVMLDWFIQTKDSDYKLPLPFISNSEEELIEAVSKKFKDLSQRKEIPESQAKNTLTRLLSEYCNESNLQVSQLQMDYLSTYLTLEVSGFSGLELLLADDLIEEIAVIGINKPVYIYHVKTGWNSTNLIFRKEQRIIDIINKMARSLGRRVTYQDPRLNAVLPDGSRLHASIPPISDLELTIRKFRKQPISVVDLIRNKTYSAYQLSFLSLVFQLGYNVLIAGNTASGKTSTLNALFCFIPLSDRILTIEETPELNIPHPHRVRLVSNPEIGADMRFLVEDSLRMRPDRVVVGEVRTTAEISALIESILSGQARGSYATFHAQSSQEVVNRMVSNGILKVDISSIDFVIIQKRILRYDPKTKRSWEERKGIEISELLGDEAIPNKIFDFNVRSGSMKGIWKNSTRFSDMANRMSLSEAELIRELEQRKNLLLGLVNKNLSFLEITKLLQSALYSNKDSILSSKSKSIKSNQTISGKKERVNECLTEESEILRDHFLI